MSKRRSFRGACVVLSLGVASFPPTAGGEVVDLLLRSPDVNVLGAWEVLATGDLDGDGVDDLVVQSGRDSAGVLFGGEHWTFPAILDLRFDEPDVHLIAPFWIWKGMISDMTGDSIGDLVLTEFHGDEVVVVHGRRNWPAAVDLTQTAPDQSISGLFGGSPYPWFAAPSVASGDFNGDGLLDLAVGAPGALCPGFDAAAEAGGAAFVFWRRDADGLLPASVTDPAEQADAAFCATCLPEAAYGLNCPRLGDTLAAGDFDGDGLADLAIAAPWSQIGVEDHTGLVHVFHARGRGRPFPGRTDVRFATGDRVIEGAASEFHTPARMLSGDFNRDGLADLFLASFDAFVPGSGERNRAGETRVVLGEGRHGRPTDRFIHFSQTPADWNAFGAELRDAAEWIAVGDVDADGGLDLLVGAPGAEGPANSRARRPGWFYGSGEAYLFLGQPFGLADTPILKDLAVDSPDLLVVGAEGWSPPRREGDGLGRTVALADFNGDGYDDLILGEAGIPDPERPDRLPLRAVVVILSPFAP